MPYAVCVTFTIHLDHWDAFLPLMYTNAKASVTNEAGCRQFDVATDAERPGDVFLYELYDDADAFQAHLKTSHFATFDAATVHMIADKKVAIYGTVAQ